MLSSVQMTTVHVRYVTENTLRDSREAFAKGPPYEAFTNR